MNKRPSPPDRSPTGERSKATLETLIASALAAIQSRTNWTRQQAEMLLGVIALAGTILICGLTLAFSSAIGQASPPTATPTMVPYPVRSAAQVITQLKRLGVPFNTVQTVLVPNPTWQASQALQFKVDTSTFLLLSYADMSKAGVDAFKATNNTAFNSWRVIQIANVILAALPGADGQLVSALASHLTTYLIVPYRSFLPTGTPITAPAP
ncbi:MAG: hypothetical protein ACYDBJ_28675 [Aggregatilineales bacterium]